MLISPKFLITYMTNKQNNASSYTRDESSGEKNSNRKRGPDKKPRKSGPEHGNYIHGEGKSRPYNYKKQSAWKEGVLRRYQFSCFITKQNSGKLQCHHLESWDSSPDRRYDITNGVALTPEVHSQFHKLYGHGANTTAQFEEFCRQHYNIDTFPWRQGNHDPSLTLESLENELSKKQAVKMEALLELIDSRGHELRDGEYVNAQSEIIVWCTHHKCSHTTIVTNYKKSRTGMPCCGKARQSDATSYHNTKRTK
jgi:hypothetical protein